MPTRLIRIAQVRYDALDEAFHGLAIRSGPDGTVLRSPVRVAGPPFWDHSRAESALRDAAL
ncbi:hypothetical protein [Jannaschia sp. W003]|uniref:hypothetical protein n=1 Tax=Jannaschia sp. W003 TaxID=2867012 RepID=UPI0021A87AFE|nr:hypothetical protein [Jannaschia sp. W003]UWQ22368.1 hypothetical protein K3554_04850 [Jannaschia sp. W003]